MMQTLFSDHQLSTYQQQYLQSNDNGTSPTWIQFIATLDARDAIPSIGSTSSPTSGWFHRTEQAMLTFMVLLIMGGLAFVFLAYQNYRRNKWQKLEALHHFGFGFGRGGRGRGGGCLPRWIQQQLR
jgi:hypothetical protein